MHSADIIVVRMPSSSAGDVHQSQACVPALHCLLLDPLLSCSFHGLQANRQNRQNHKNPGGLLSRQQARRQQQQKQQESPVVLQRQSSPRLLPSPNRSHLSSPLLTTQLIQQARRRDADSLSRQLYMTTVSKRPGSRQAAQLKQRRVRRTRKGRAGHLAEGQLLIMTVRSGIPQAVLPQQSHIRQTRKGRAEHLAEGQLLMMTVKALSPQAVQQKQSMRMLMQEEQHAEAASVLQRQTSPVMRTPFQSL